MKTLSFLILLSQLALVHHAYGQQSIEGNWISEALERNANGSFATREFVIKKTTWEIRFTLYPDSSYKTPVFIFRAEGDYYLQEKSPFVSNSYNALFKFSRKFITLKTQDSSLVRKFGLKSCDLQFNAEKDITATGCAYLLSKAACAEEYDLVSLQNGRLLLGARPASGGMCNASKRPRQLGPPLKRNTKLSPTRKDSNLPFRNIVDLTHTLNSNFPFIPTDVTFPFSLKPIATIEGHGVAANEWKIHEHIGTQIDAPNHFIKDGMAVEQLDIRALLVPAIVIDISSKASVDRDAVLTIGDILDWEKVHGPIPSDAAVFMYSGWESKIHSPDFIGLDSAHVKHFPGISNEAAKFLVSERDIAGVGVDVISFDPGYDGTYQSHKTILGKGKWALECLANLKLIPAKGAFVFIGAPKVEGATGGLARVIAVW